MRKALVVIVCLLMFVAICEPTYAKQTFRDILGKTGGHFEAIHFLNELDVYDYKDGTFGLTQPVTRGEASKILYNLLGGTGDEAVLEPVRTYQSNFRDVTASTKFLQEIRWAYEVGIFDGDERGQFNPQQPVKRAHLAKILVQSFGLEELKLHTFTDVTSASWYYQDVMVLATHGITTGNEKNQFLPNANVTGAQLATFLYRTLQLYDPSIGSEQLEIETPVSQSPQPDTAVPKAAVLYSEYDFNWHVVGQNEQLTLEGMINNKVVAGYLTVKGDQFSGAPIRIGVHTAADVKKQLGKPVSAILKNNTNYFLTTNDEFAIYLLDDYYVTYFFDLHKKQIVRSILYISKNQELKKEGYYGTKNKILNAQGHSEQLMVELMNQSRTVEGLKPLRYAKEWTKVARSHSTDMAKENYFDHTNLQGEEPFDRMKRGGMKVDAFSTWGENISFGQFNAIYSHEGLMNSYGHRVNILNGDFANAIVGIDIDGKNQPFYTMKFYTELK